MNNKKKRTLFLILVFVLLIGISVGYAVITTALSVNGTVGLGRASFAIHFDNVGTLTHKATVNTEAYISDPVNKQAISFDVYLANIGDDYQFTTDIVNEGTIPGQVDSITLEGITESQARILDYELYYTGTTRKVKPGDYWLPGAVKNATFKIKYVIKDETLDTDLPQDDVTLNPTVVIRFKSGSIEDFRSRAAASKLSQNVRYMSSDALNPEIPTSASEYEGLYYLVGTEDDDFPIYFYRGGHAKVHNHVKFGGYCWRILRTTNTGGIKIIYNGTPDGNGYCSNTTGSDTSIGTSIFAWNAPDFNKDVVVAQYLSAWYFEHLIQYQEYLEDTEFCNDNQWGGASFSTSCSIKRSVGNGQLSYPIGLITANEVTMGGLTSNESTYSYLYTNTDYWTMSRGHNSIGNLISDVQSNGRVLNITNTSTIEVRPVVSLNSEVSLTSGSGTPEDPYTVS